MLLGSTVALNCVRDWSLITGRGGGYKTGGGHVKFYAYEKGGVEKVLAMVKGGGAQKIWGSFYAVASSFSYIVGGGAKSFHVLKVGGVKSFTLS